MQKEESSDHSFSKAAIGYFQEIQKKRFHYFWDFDRALTENMESNLVQ